MSDPHPLRRSARREAAVTLTAIDRRGRVDACWITAGGGGGTIFRTVRPIGLTQEQRRAWRDILAIATSTPLTYARVPSITLNRTQHAWLLKRPMKDLIACLSARLWSDGTMTEANVTVKPKAGGTQMNILARLQRSAGDLLRAKEIEQNFLDVVDLLSARRVHDHAALTDALLAAGSLNEERIQAVLAGTKSAGRAE